MTRAEYVKQRIKYLKTDLSATLTILAYLNYAYSPEDIDRMTERVIKDLGELKELKQEQKN